MKKFILKLIALSVVFFLTQGCSTMQRFVPTVHVGDGQTGFSIGDLAEINLHKTGDGKGMAFQANAGGETSLKLGATKLEAWNFKGKKKPLFELTLIKITDKGEIDFGYVGWNDVFETALVKYDMPMSQISLAPLKLYSGEGISEMALLKSTFGGDAPPVESATTKKYKDEAKKKISEVNKSLKETFGNNEMLMGAVWGSIATPICFILLAIIMQMLLFWVPSKARKEIYWFLVMKSRWMAYLITFVFVISYVLEDSQIWIILDKFINGGNYSAANLYFNEERQANVLLWAKWLLFFLISWTTWCYIFEKIREFGKKKIMPLIAEARNIKKEAKSNKKGKQQVDDSTSEVLIKMVESNTAVVKEFQDKFLELCKMVTNQRAETDKEKVESLFELVKSMKGESKPVPEFFEHLELHTEIQGNNLKNLVQLLVDVGVIEKIAQPTADK